MRRAAAAVALLLAIFLAPLSTLRAEDAKTYAVIVGIGQFEDKAIKDRPSAITDAKAIYDTLTDKSVGGVDPANVQLLLSGKGEVMASKVASKANILAALKDVAAKAHKDDKVIVYLVGQGAPSGDRTCIFAVDSTVKDRAKNAITPAEIRPELKALKAQKVCIMLDINLKSFDPGKETVVEPNIMDLVRAFLGMDEKDETELPVGRAVILAGSGANPTVVTDKKEGIFTTAVVAGLRGAADKEGKEADGTITVDELTKYLDSEIGNLARKFGTTREQKEQIPFVVARISLHALPQSGGAGQGRGTPQEVRGDRQAVVRYYQGNRRRRKEITVARAEVRCPAKTSLELPGSGGWNLDRRTVHQGARRNLHLHENG